MEKERKPLRHPAGGVHGYDIQCCLGLCGLIQLRHNPIQTEASFGVAVPAFHDVAFAGIPVQLLANSLAAFCFGPLLAFRQIQV